MCSGSADFNLQGLKCFTFIHFSLFLKFLKSPSVGTDGHGGLMFGGYSQAARERCFQVLYRLNPTRRFEHLECV